MTAIVHLVGHTINPKSRLQLDKTTLLSTFKNIAGRLFLYDKTQGGNRLCPCALFRMLGMYNKEIVALLEPHHFYHTQLSMLFERVPA